MRVRVCVMCTLHLCVRIYVCVCIIIMHVQQLGHMYEVDSHTPYAMDYSSQRNNSECEELNGDVASDNFTYEWHTEN